jgi:hypothetical protein
MTSSLDLIPWEQKPETPEETVFNVEWNGGLFTIPRYGYLEVNELNSVRQVDPSNALYRLTSKTAVSLHKALQDRANADEAYSHTVLKQTACFALLSSLLARHMGAMASLSEIEQLIHIDYSHLISPFLEDAKNLSERVPIRSATVILQRIRPGWTDVETQKLPPPLFNQIYKLYQDEESEGRGPEDPDEELRELEESLGKLRQEVTLIATGQTGAAPSGNVAGSGQEQQNSAANILAGSQDHSSSRPFQPATKPKKKSSIEKS